MRKFLSCLLAGGILGLSGTAMADRALVIGAPEAQRGGLLSEQVPDLPRSLEEAGFDVFAADPRTLAAMQDALSRFMRGIEAEERIVIYLGGRFVRSNRDSWILAATDAPAPDLAFVGSVGLPVSVIMEVAEQVPGGAVVAFGVEDDPGGQGYGLRSGLRIGSVPQGVTVLRGAPSDMARFVGGPLLQPGRGLASAIAAGDGIAATGLVTDRVIFIPEGVTRTTGGPDRGEVERAIWEATEDQDTIEAYRGYLARYPAGEFAEAARSAIAEIEAEPNRAARLAEEALGLSRDDRRQIQRHLTLLDFKPRGIDGIFGPGTRGAVTRFQGQSGFPQTGYLNQEQIERLTLQAERRTAELEAEAERRRLEQEAQDRAWWEATGSGADEAGLRTYLQKYPDGLFSDIATVRLEAIEAEKRQQAAVQDRAAWDQASQAGTLQAYRGYLRAFPQGAFASDAQAQIDALLAENSAERQQAERAERALGLNPVLRMLVEQRLAALKLEPGRVDGKFDDNTRRAIRRFQRARDLPVTGYLSERTISRMLSDAAGGFVIRTR